MNYLKYITFSFFAIIYFSSCNKESINESSNSVALDSCKLQKIIYTITLPSPSGFVYHECHVTYSGNEISGFKHYYANGDLFAWHNFIYDSQNNLIRSEYHQNTYGNIIRSHNYNRIPFSIYLESIDSSYSYGAFRPAGHSKYTYNTALSPNHIVRITSDNQSVNFHDVNYYWQNDDPVQFTFTEPNSSVLQTTTISYDTTKINKLNQVFSKFWLQAINNAGNLFTMAHDKYLQHFFLGKHIITKVTSTGDPYYQITGDFTYTYNSLGFIKEMKVNNTTLLKFYYSCD